MAKIVMEMWRFLAFPSQDTTRSDRVLSENKPDHRFHEGSSSRHTMVRCRDARTPRRALAKCATRRKPATQAVSASLVWVTAPAIASDRTASASAIARRGLRDARRCRQPSSDYSTPDKCKRILDDLGESYDNDADVTTLQIKAAQAVKRTKTGVRLNFEESVTAAEIERLPSVEKLLNWRDEVYAKRFVNKGPITIKCLIGQVRPPASPLPAPPSLPSAKANPRAAGSTCTAGRACPRSAA